MPSEPLPWDRKDFFRDRKHGHDRPEPLGPVARWRDCSSSSSYGGSRNNDLSPRWGFPSDFRRTPGHGKQGGWHTYPEDSAHGYPTARSGDPFLDDNGFRPSMPRGDGRYGRFYRDSRSSFGHKEWRGHSWEAYHHHNVPPNAPGRPHLMNDQRSVGGSPMRGTNLYADPCEWFHSKGQDDKTSEVNGQRVDKENSLVSHDWKPFKGSRSGSLTSRGSGFSHSSSLKSNGGESNDLKGDLPAKTISPLQSPSKDAVACAPSAVPLEETPSWKKPRLGWGEGLAKYEKKKVEGPEENLSEVANAACLSNVEPTHSHTSNFVDKSPQVTGLTDCSSPATPSSVACSSSPGLEDKTCTKPADTDGCSVLLMPVSENQLEGWDCSQEKSELNLMTNLSSLLNELLQADDKYYVESGSVKSSALNKLLLWKGDVSKELELTETEIDLLENELKSLKSDSGSNNACPALLNSLSADCKDVSCDDANMILGPPPLEVVLSGDMLVGDMLALPGDDVRESLTQNNDENIDSLGTGTAKFEEAHTPQKTVCGDGWKHDSSGHAEFAETTRTLSKNLVAAAYALSPVGTSRLGDDRRVTHLDANQAVSDPEEDGFCDAIFACNKESATRAAEVLFKLLPSGNSHVDSEAADGASYLVTDLTIKDKFLRRKQSLRLKEKVMALKYRALHHLWKEDVRFLSMKSYRTKLQKKSDLGSRTMQSGNQKHRSSIHSRFSSPAESLSPAPTAETINSIGKHLSDSHVKIYRKSLKMPSMVLDEKGKMSRFMSSNGLVEDPCAMEKERALINPWTPEEKEIFMDKLAICGKDFSKIASFLDHKTTADCIEFYYKNHKAECFEKTKKQLELKKQGKPLLANTYLLTSGKKWGREMNVASLDILGEASVIAALAEEAMEPCNKKLEETDAILEASTSSCIAQDGSETLAADVLAGICGSMSSEAMSSCITCSVEPGEANQDCKHQKVEVTQSIDDYTYSDESWEMEMDPVDWTDDEKSSFVQAFSSYGKDFMMISRCVQTKSRDQCKVFFSKARKCLGLDNLHPGTGLGGLHSRNGADSGACDAEDAGIVETGSVVCSDKSGSRMDEDLQLINQDVSKPEALITELSTLEDNCGARQLGHCVADSMLKDGGEAEGDVQDIKSVAADDSPRGSGLLITKDDPPKTEASVSVGVATEMGLGPAVSSADMGPVVVGFTNEKATAALENGVNTSLQINLEAPRDLWCQKSRTQDNLIFSHSGSFVMNQDEPSQVTKSFPMDMSIKTDMNGGANNDASMQLVQPSESIVAEIPFLVKNEGQSNGNNHAGSSCTLKTELPGNGDLKLFGKILRKPTLADEPTPRAQDNDKHHLTGGIGQDMNGVSTSGKYEQNSFLGLESVPIRSYGFWDGTKIQTGFSSLPDSAMLLAKYPSAFANYSKEQPLPFRLDVKQRQDSLTEVQRNGLKPLSSLQQQGKGLVKLNVVQGEGGDILVGGSCTSISDPVAAVKLHYARSHQYGGIREM